ncbi:hypothetical protein [Paenibacillus sp. PastM-3]|uniref:hypothetical protein n=1 Tax=Paenibacillus sp. PastM-3 TaxID=2940534 RepID=UPI002476822B|nr:hypothetical protein [Paenibacillus sp. PastM-3]
MLPSSIYWIGGSACAGKSTLAGMYAEKYGLQLYACDEHFDQHLQRITAERQPALSRISGLTMNEVFLTREVQEQLDTYIECFQEDFSFVLDDLACMGEEAVVVEGNQLLPALVAPLLRHTDRAIWVIPTEQFQLEHYSKRTWIQGILQRTEEPEHAFCNWMKRDALFAEKVKQEALRLKLPLMEVDGSTSLQENFERIERCFSS